MPIENTHDTGEQRSSPPAVGTTLMTIPNEILEKIFIKIALDAAAVWSHIFLPFNTNPKGILTLMLVCQKWHRIAEPILYRRQQYIAKPPITSEHAGSLLHLLDRKPYLAGYIRELSIDARPDNFDEAVLKILHHCKRLTLLHLDGQLSAPPSAVPAAIQSLPLKSLSITTVESSLLRDGFFNFLLGLRYLENLKIGDWASPYPTTDLKRLPADFRRQSNIKTLQLKEPNTYPTLTEDCLALSAALEEVILTGFEFSRSSWYYSSDQIQALLLPHCDSLRRVELSSILKGDSTPCPLPDFSVFPRLEQLSLCPYHVFYHEKPTDLYRKLAAPNLQLLILHFHPESTHYVGADVFGEAQIDWLEEFASVHSQTCLAANFRELHIIFFPSVEDSEDLSWPWDRLDRAAEIVSRHGIKLIYSEPPTSRAEWETEAEAMAKVLKEGAARRKLREQQRE
ncbi:predicted protein [Uncinocarpus reesii 1704]|uniref:Uncharacterized protein n=1 Tax=Uncinocarpus reesii (strain UAMH 1704) TaxID=336963 RepID=C4JW03_UNCRE|nr:uncharacterized protein UREG_06745 [Uncinocarpus reesii 1704]EEP81880.1 predicted protein [Uncinocarpus reesii 1704]